jgi:L-glyceraldehyde 3-phosphate reductase
LHREDVTEDKVAKARHLNEVAQARGQSLAQMAIAWVLRKPEVTSALIGASRVQQIDDCVAALEKLEFSKVELDKIEGILTG